MGQGTLYDVSNKTMLHNYNPEMSSRPLSTHSPHSSVSIFMAPSKNSLFQIKCPIQLIKLWQCPMTKSSLVTVSSLSMNIGLTMRSHWNEQQIYLNEVERATDWVFHNNPTENGTTYTGSRLPRSVLNTTNMIHQNLKLSMSLLHLNQ